MSQIVQTPPSKKTGPIAGLIFNSVGPRATAILGSVLSLVGLTAAFFCKTVHGLVLTNGLITGMGLCLAGNLVGVVPGQYFLKRRALAYGIIMSGGSVGLFVAGPMTEFLINRYGLHGTFLLLGAISFHTCIAGFVFRRNPYLVQSVTYEDARDNIDIKTRQGLGDTTNSETAMEHLSMLTENEKFTASNEISCVDESPEEGPEKSKLRFCQCQWSELTNLKAFIFYNLSITLWSLGQSACIFHLPNFAHNKGSSLLESSSLFTAIGASGLFSRVFTGLIASESRIGYTTLQMGLVGVSGILALLFPLYSHSYLLQLIFSLAYGLYSEGVNSLMAPITIDQIGSSSVAVGFGIVYLSCGVGFFLGPPAASFLYVFSGSYESTFIFTGACLLLCSMATATSSVLQKKTFL